MSATKVTTTTQSSQAPSPKKVAKPVAEGEKKEKAPRKPTLKEKHSRFLVSNYSIIQFLSSKGLLTDEGVESAYTEIKLFAPVDEQEAFYESYITEAKTTKKAMTKFIRERNKPPKAPKKSRAKKSDGDAQEAPKKSRAKKTTQIANDTEVDVVAQATSDNGATNLVNELTAAANAAPSTPEPTSTSTTVPDAPKKGRKPRAKKAESDAPKEKKPRATKKSKKEEVPPVVETAPVQEEEDEEIHTQEIEINGKSYLIDSDNNIYSVDTHDEIGTYNAETNTITAP